MKLRLGYAGINTELREKDIFTNRTCRLVTAQNPEYGIKYLQELAKKNLSDLIKILQWNEEHGIRFFRISSDLCPHITNPVLLRKKDRANFKKLVYPIDDLKPMFELIGNYAKKHKHRLTFHPDQFVNLGGSDDVILRSSRDLWYQALMLEMMNLDCNSILVIHGGGIYGDKEKTTKRWVDTFDKLPLMIKSRLVIENDEFSYNITDVMKISAMVKPYMPWHDDRTKFKIPIVLDLFHYKCYQKYLGGQPPLVSLVSQIVSSWKNRTPKMHISEQKSGGIFGAHSDYVCSIPSWVLHLAKTQPLDLMIEAKQKELATLWLMKKYKIG